MRNRLIITIGRFAAVRGQALPMLNQPQLIVEVAEPNEVRLDATFDNDTTGNIFEYADNPSFNNSTVVINQLFPFSLMAANLNQPITDYYFRLRATAQGFRPSNFASFATGIMEQTPVSVTNLQGLEGDNAVVLNWSSNANIESVVIERRTTGAFQSIGTTGGETFTDNTAVNGTTYEYRVVAVPINFNFVGQPSALITATPSGTPQLATPTGLQLTESGTNGTLTLSWLAVSGATSYDVLLDGLLQLNQAGTSFEFTGLTVGQLYGFGVVAKANGFIDSNQAVRNYAPIDNDTEFLTPEQFGAEAYYKPLDGRLSEGFEFPLINLTPIDEAAFNSLNTGLNYNNYPNGVTILQPVDSSEQPIQGVFTSQDVGKSFCGLRCHRNGAEGEFEDEFPPFGISSRYATVIWQDGNICLVDFEFNGLGETPQPTVKGKGYVFFDNSTALTNTFSAWKSPSVSEEIRLLPVGRSGYLLTVYVAPQLDATIVDVQKNCLINTGSTLRARIKWGIEDYWQFGFGVKPRKYTQPISLFNFSEYGGKFITHNIQWVAPHGSFPSAESFLRRMVEGSLIGGGVFFVVNGENFIEHDEMVSGNGADDYLFDVRFHAVTSLGNYTDGIGELNDVDSFAFIGSKNVHYSGSQAVGIRGGNLRGGLFEFLQDFKVDFEPQNKFAPATQKFTARFTNDYTGLATGADTDYLPACVEITSNEGNWFATRTMGGALRSVMIHVDKFVFFSNVNRYNQFAIFNEFYGNGFQTFETNQNGLNTVNTKKMLFDWDILTEKELDGVTPKIITVSRDYLINLIQPMNSSQPTNQVFTMGMPMKNTIRTHISWSTVFQKAFGEYNQGDYDYIKQIDRRPKGWQVGDQFRICAWLEVVDLDNFEVGDTVTGNVSGNTGVIRTIDDYVHSKRLIIGAATGSFESDTEINGVTVTDSSSYNPLEIYTAIRKQSGDWAQDNFFSVFILNSLTGLSNGQTITGQVSGAVGVIQAVGTSTIGGGNRVQVRVTSGQYEAGEVVNANGQSYTIQTGTDLENPNGLIYKHTNGGDNATFAGMGVRFRSSLYYETVILDKDLPDDLNGKDETIPTFEIEVVNSEAEYLLDGQPRQMRHTYRSLGRYQNGFNNFHDRRRVASGGLANGYSTITGFDSEPWLSIGESSGHLLYIVGEITRMWYDGDANNSFARINNTSFNLNQLQRYTKGWFIKNVTNPPVGQWRSAESASTRNQLEAQRLIYESNPEYSPQWADDEGLPGRPKLWLMGSNSNDQMQGWVDPTGQNIVRDSNAANAPDLPKTIKDILIDLNEITP